MPTAYTSNMDVDFNAFVMRCSRAMGALHFMRDEPLDAPLPTVIQSDSDVMYKSIISELTSRLVSISKMTDKEVEEAALAQFDKALKDFKAQKNVIDSLEKKYLDMLNQVNSWQPPTAKHEGLKFFMLEQLEQSIRFDCSNSLKEPLAPLPIDEWRATNIEDAKNDMGYYSSKLKQEELRLQEQNLWLAELRDSLQLD